MCTRESNYMLVELCAETTKYGMLFRRVQREKLTKGDLGGDVVCVVVIRLLEFLMSEEVSNNLSHKGISMMASSGYIEGGSGRVPTGDGHVASAPRFKQRKMSTVQDFLPGCGREGAPITRLSGQATID
ncbi:hypothetical protein J1N35_005127 [Gossypium stocksii]|uniref:Uncharacterized protein n=1 Tax=Gossypium stocksii TaxID=47602 RepID=A0A9D4AGQ8_9ROSI|nr:hypothetical protein J1N35_005127 [Gossypium stocksii]